jgi:nucleoid DNA-binding protein
VAPQDIVNSLSESSGLSRQTVSEVLNALGAVLADELAEKGVLRLDQIGEFVVDHRSGRRGVNTETKEIFVIPPQDYVLYLPALECVERCNTPP